MNKITSLEFIIENLSDRKQSLQNYRLNHEIDEEIYWQNINFLNERIHHYSQELERIRVAQ